MSGPWAAALAACVAAAFAASVPVNDYAAELGGGWDCDGPLALALLAGASALVTTAAALFAGVCAWRGRLRGSGRAGVVGLLALAASLDVRAGVASYGGFAENARAGSPCLL